MKIYILNTLETGLATVDLLKKELPIQGLIGLTQRQSQDRISGYQYLKPYCQDNGLDFIEVRNYSLAREDDRERLLGLEIDLLIVAGWQRLIPPWLARHCQHGAIGVHGSTQGITGGRGRSPQNWALILGKKAFSLSIFKIDEGIDSGRVIDTRAFDLTALDDIRTSYYKVNWLTARMIIDNIRNGRIAAGETLEQQGEPRYLPQRLPEDGWIDWSRGSGPLYDFIRALTRPYPGAFSRIGQGKLVIWKGRPLSLPGLSADIPAGEILKLCPTGEFLVKTGDSALLVEDHTFSPEDAEFGLQEGQVLSSVDFKKQMAAIVDRHYQKNPDLTLSDDILNLL